MAAGSQVLLPVALQQLLAELRAGPWPAAAEASASSSNTPPLRTRFDDDLSEDRYGHFFKPSESLGKLTAAERERWCQVRLEVLTAIARCRTLNTILLRQDLEVGEDCRAEEVEALLGGLASISDNSALLKLDLTSFREFGTSRMSSCLSCKTACVALGGLLRCSRTLRWLILTGAGMDVGGLGHVVSGLQANPISALQVLDLAYNKKLGEGGGAAPVAALLDHTLCPSLRDVNIAGIGLNVAGAQMVGQVLARNILLRALKIGSIDDEEALGMLLRTGLGETRSSDIDVEVTLGNRSIIKLEVGHMPHACVCDMNLVLRTNPVLEECNLEGSECEFATSGLELDKLAGLKILSLQGKYNTLFMKTVFSSLGKNGTLQRLNVTNRIPLDMDIFTHLMQSLNRNIILKTLEIRDNSWQKSGKCALVEAALRRNRRQDAFLPTLYRQHFKFGIPKVGRFFLCGPPRAGKSTIRQTMVRYSQRSRLLPTWMTNMCRPNMCMPWEMTKGIEIEHIYNENENLQVSIWDLAGQAEFRILHDYLFPNIHQACLFSFVFSPFDHELGDIMSDEHLSEEFEKELNYWLTFIASNVKLGGVVKPKLLVIITYLDKFKTKQKLIETILYTKLNQLREKFSDLIYIIPKIEIIKAYSMKYMNKVSLEVFTSLKHLCEESKNVPEVCEKLSSVLTKWVSKNPYQPFMGQKVFYDFCVKELEELNKFETTDRETILVAISSYLHDTGKIIHFKDSELIAVDPNWITHVFLGNLTQSHRPLLPVTSQGFVERDRFHQILTSFTNKYIALETQDLLNIMLELELCYDAPLEDMKTQGFFIPITINQKTSSSIERSLQWLTGYETADDYEFLGRRLQCEDLRTFLTEGFFPRFQVVLRNRLFLDLGIHFHQYIFGHNLISIVYNGMDILIEYSGGGVIGDYVDILIRSKQRPGFAHTFMRQHILEDLRDLCASARGCPGVSLAEGFINPYCVSHLIPCRLRRNQAYLETDLTKFLLDEEQTLKCDEGYFGMRSILDFVHSWPPIGDKVNSIRVSHRVEEFVDGKYLADMVQKNVEFYERQRDRIEKVATDLVPASKANCTSSKSTSQPILLRWRSDLSVGNRMTLWDMISGKLDIHHSQVMDELHHNQKEVLDKLDHNQKEMLELIRSVEADVMKSKKEILKALKRNMDDIVGYHGSDMPRRPFLSSDGVSFQERFMALILIGKPIHLHLMCEAKDGNHVVQGQPGYPMLVEKSNYKWIRKLFVMGVSLFLFLAKAGLHVAAGLGNAVPDFANWAGAMPVTAIGLGGETLLNHQQLPDVVAVDGEDVNVDVWLSLKGVLESLHDRMWGLFQLTQVRYSQGKGTAWLCTKCMKKCKAAGLLMQR